MSYLCYLCLFGSSLHPLVGVLMSYLCYLCFLRIVVSVFLILFASTLMLDIYIKGPGGSMS
jgi:hypothetical protein